MNALDALVSTLIDVGKTPAQFAVGTVQSFTLNGSDPATAVVRWKGADVTCRCPRSYTPANGHTVVMIRLGAQLLIVGAY